MRSALKRGLARQVVAQAEEADLPALFDLTRTLRPNLRALTRCAQRLQARRGVVRVTVGTAGGAAGLVVILRNRRQMILRTAEAELFAEEALFYTRVMVLAGSDGAGFQISRASFSRHALERLVERSAVPLNRPLLPAVDAEAVTILRQLSRASLIEEGPDLYAGGAQAGVWAGRIDQSALEPEWRLSFGHTATRLPVFSARTFLGPDQMRPTLWLRWQADPGLSLR